MPLPLPNLDNRSYTDLVEEARALIPTYDPFWTDHNPSDPGITLIELFAWLTEMLIYQADHVPDARYETFLKLLNGSGWTLMSDLDTAKRQSVLALRERYRAVSCEDFEYLATRTWPKTPEAQALGDEGIVRRARCVSKRNLDLPNSTTRDAPEHISLVVVPGAPSDIQQLLPSEALRAALWKFLDERRLLTMRHHVVGPNYVKVALTAKLFPRADAKPGDVKQAAVRHILAFFHPLTGGPDHSGWPFGRDVYVSEVYQVLEQIPIIDYVEDVVLATPDFTAPDPSREQRTNGSLIGITLETHELVTMNVDADSFTIG